MSVRLSYVDSNIRDEMKCCLSVCHTWIPIWGMKWNVCPSLWSRSQYEVWNEMSVRLCEVDPNMRDEMSVRLSYMESNMRNEMKCLSVCHTWNPIWGIKWNEMSVRPSVIRGFQYKGVNEMLSFRLLYVDSNMRDKMKWNVCPSVWSRSQYEVWNEMSVRLSYVDSNIRNEMKCLSVCHTWNPIWGIKWNEMSVRLSYVESNIRDEMKCLSVCHTWIPIWGMKWNVCPSVMHGFQYEGLNEMSVRL